MRLAPYGVALLIAACHAPSPAEVRDAVREDNERHEYVAIAHVLSSRGLTDLGVLPAVELASRPVRLPGQSSFAPLDFSTLYATRPPLGPDFVLEVEPTTGARPTALLMSQIHGPCASCDCESPVAYRATRDARGRLFILRVRHLYDRTRTVSVPSPCGTGCGRAPSQPLAMFYALPDERGANVARIIEVAVSQETVVETCDHEIPRP
jgi:hypothetical protein